ncbi:MAG: DUF1501 domain-containing protein [Bacteroidota bacterium]
MKTDLHTEMVRRHLQRQSRRTFLRKSGLGLGAFALGNLLGCGQKPTLASQNEQKIVAHFAPKAKRVIFLHMAGGPSQLELFDYKPDLDKLDGQACPDSLLKGKRFAFIQGVPNMLGHRANFSQYGQSGAWVSDLLPHFQQSVDKVCMLKAVHTDEFNHAPAQFFVHTGFPRQGRPSMGSWVTYGLGSENENLPGFVVLVSGASAPSAGKSIWGSGFLPSVYQGVQLRSQGDPVQNINNPDGLPRSLRKSAIETISKINQVQYEEMGDPETLARISQYELAFRMQMTVPEAMDIGQEPQSVHDMYGTRPGETAFANNCLLARRLAERGVRFIQLYHRGWDSHGSNQYESLHHGFRERCREVDQPMAALLQDLQQRGLLEETLVIWGGEFGRTPMRENRGGKTAPFDGRDHHKEAFTMWMAGGGVQAGLSYGKTDPIGYEGISGRIHVHDLQATILHLLGMDHTRLTYRFQGRDFRLTDLYGEVVNDILV